MVGGFSKGLLPAVLHSRGFEFVALLPLDSLGQAGRLPAQGKSKPRHGRVPDKIHLGMVFITGLVIMLLDVISFLLKAPSFGVPLVLHSFINRKRWDAHSRQAEMIGAVELPGLGARIRTYRQPELFRSRLHRWIKRGPLCP